MKKVLFACAIALSTTLAANAQKSESGAFKVGVGATVGLPMADVKSFTSVAFKGDLQGEYAATEQVGVTLSAGYLKYVGKSGVTTGSIIPVLVGGKVAFTENLYGHAQLGLSFISDGGGSAFTYAPSVGYIVSEKFDVSLRYEAYSKGGGTASYLGLRAGFSF